MKTTADIEKITLAELEKMADDTSVEVPECLERKVTDAVLAAEVLGERPSVKKVLMLVPAAAAAIVAAVAIGFNVHNLYRTPVDTFSTPEEAFACLEHTFSMIGKKTDKSLEVAGNMNSKLEKTYNWILKNE